MPEFYIEVRYENNERVANQKVIFRDKHGDPVWEGETNEDGKIHIKGNNQQDLSGVEEFSSFEVAGQAAKENWFIGSKDYIEESFWIKNPQAEYNPEQAGELKSLTGQLYYFDGTQPYQEISVEVELPSAIGGMRYKADRNGYSDDKGKFFIELPREYDVRFLKELQFWIGGERIESKRVHYANNFLTIILPRIDWIGKGGQDGGVITGKVIDKNGELISGAKIEAKVATDNIFGGFFGTNAIEARTNKYGRFALGFSGGTTIKSITVDGNAPLRIYRNQVNRETGEKEEVDIRGDQLRAGSFNVNLVREGKFFGLF